ncbi:MAG: hypothetical protein EOO77_06165 [Oxalobacteraceae bacterium]|nr:MAG: hypothetical protein EOO77_06165 [Oxalobacteraceae bacterium]
MKANEQLPMTTRENLAASLLQLQEAARVEQIESDSTLGVFLVAQQMTLVTMASVVESQEAAIDGRAVAMERAMSAQVNVVKAEVERCRQETARLQAVTGLAVEERKKDSQDLAKELAKLISKGIKEATLIREKRFNRMQNWSAAGFLAFCLLSCFVGGQVWSNYKLDSRVLERCERNQVAGGGTTWCDMIVARGQ